ncbi:MAG: site-2 protease family protein, partial [Oscillospiraceae bacterium]|nr:site-2 protease family protein [Oscillospiraceae bacterium]
YIEDFSFFIQLQNRGSVDLVVRRGGETIKLNNFPLERREYTIDGEIRLRYGITFNSVEPNLWEKLKYACYTSMNYVRLVRVSLAMLISGNVGLGDLSGPVGIVSTMNDIALSSLSVSEAISKIANFAALIGINMAVMNLLPLPALDGGKITFIFISWIIEKVSRRRVNPKYEGYIHTAAFALLMGLMIFILVNDVVKIIAANAPK